MKCLAIRSNNAPCFGHAAEESGIALKIRFLVEIISPPPTFMLMANRIWVLATLLVGGVDGDMEGHIAVSYSPMKIADTSSRFNKSIQDGV